MIQGYDKNVQELALERGEIDGLGFTLAGLQGRRSSWRTNNLIRPIVQFGRIDRHPELSDVPTAREAAPGPDERAIVDLVDAPFLIAYPFGLPPGVPSDRAATMRKAFAAALTDTGFRDEIVAKNMEYSPRTGEDVQAIVDKIGRSPAHVVERYKQIVGSASD